MLRWEPKQSASRPLSLLLAALQDAVAGKMGKQRLGSKGLAVQRVGTPGRERGKREGPEAGGLINSRVLGFCADTRRHIFPEWLGYLEVY